jgi:excinuclease UvrABC nuclease subunit
MRKQKEESFNIAKRRCFKDFYLRQCSLCFKGIACAYVLYTCYGNTLPLITRGRHVEFAYRLPITFQSDRKKMKSKLCSIRQEEKTKYERESAERSSFQWNVITHAQNKQLVTRMNKFFLDNIVGMTWIRPQVMSYGICGEQSDTGVDFFEYFGFLCQFSFHQLLHVY